MQNNWRNVWIVNISGLYKSISLDSSLSPEDKAASIPPTQVPYTPRPELWSVVQAIANFHPAAIGIDVDFSADTSLGGAGPPPSENSIFLKKCLLGPLPQDSPRGERVPIVLGVDQMEDEPSDESKGVWIGDTYSPLGGSIEFGLPHQTFPDFTQVRLWVKGENSEHRLLSFGANLAQYLPNKQTYDQPSNSWFSRSQNGYYDKQTHTDFNTVVLKTGYLINLEKRVIQGFDLRALKGPQGDSNLLKGKIVIFRGYDN